ncbi:MAG: phosphatidylglycerophosphatase A [Bacteroidia bacterium]|nr:phosphatidylglycerophosphatase A [Bacteroidia bacterium]
MQLRKSSSFPSCSPDVWDKVALGWINGLGSGYLPFAPATWGSGVGWLLAWIESLFPWWGRLFFLLAALAFSVWAAKRLSPLPSKDPRWFVADEVIALLAIACIDPWISLGKSIGAFCFFRFWDIVKLWPAESAEKLPTLWGIFMDDAIAAYYTLLCLRLLA